MPKAGAGTGGGRSHSVSSHRSTSHATSSHRVNSSPSRPKTSSPSFSSRPSSSRPKPASTPSYKPEPPKRAEPARRPEPVHTPPFAARPTPPPMTPPIAPPPPRRGMQTVIINNPAPRAAVYTEPKRESIPPTPPAAPPRHMAPPHEPPKKRGHLARNILLALTAIFLICSLILIFGKRTDVTASTSQRVKLDVVTFQNDCIVDELDWFENIANTEKQLQNFYNETGVQPYIVLKAYDPELTSDEKKEAYANTWYDEHIDNQGTFLFMYFAEEDADNEIGLMTTVNGKQVTSVMDAEAVEIFWNYIDEYWYSDASTDDLFANVFDKTAARIMRVTTTAMDVLKTIVIGLTVLCALLLITVILKEKFRRDKEKAEETERILSTPLNDMEKPSDDLLNKYSN